MTESRESASMQDDNGMDCSYAIIRKAAAVGIIILRDWACGIFPYPQIKDGTLYKKQMPLLTASGVWIKGDKLWTLS